MFTAEMDHISYAKVQVETNISHPLPNSLELHTIVGVINKNIEYGWRPKNCADCAKVSHTTEECRIREAREKNDGFVEQPRKKRRARKRRKAVAKWVAKEHTTNSTCEKHRFT